MPSDTPLPLSPPPTQGGLSAPAPAALPGQATNTRYPPSAPVAPKRSPPSLDSQASTPGLLSVPYPRGLLLPPATPDVKTHKPRQALSPGGGRVHTGPEAEVAGPPNPPQRSRPPARPRACSVGRSEDRGICVHFVSRSSCAWSRAVWGGGRRAGPVLAPRQGLWVISEGPGLRLRGPRLTDAEADSRSSTYNA